MLNYKYIFQIKYTEAILSVSTRKLLWLNADCSLKNEFIVLFSISFGTLSFARVAVDARFMPVIRCSFSIVDQFS